MRSLFPAVRPSGTIIPFVKFLRSVNSDIFQGFFTTTKTQFLYLTLTLTLAPEKLEIWNWNCCVVCMICDMWYCKADWKYIDVKESENGDPGLEMVIAVGIVVIIESTNVSHDRLTVWSKKGFPEEWRRVLYRAWQNTQCLKLTNDFQNFVYSSWQIQNENTLVMV